MTSVLQDLKREESEYKIILNHLKSLIADWKDFILDHGPIEDQSIFELLGNAELFAGKLIEYTKEKTRRREEAELNGETDADEASLDSESQRVKNIELNDPSNTNHSQKKLIISEKDLDLVELDSHIAKDERKSKLLDLVKLRQYNMDVFDETFTSFLHSRGKSGPSSKGLSTTANLISNKASNNRVTHNKFDFTGFTLRKSSLKTSYR